MALQFTPAGQRVVDAATRWRLGNETGETGPVELLLGLLDEPEYRAAGILAGRGIDSEAVRRRWPAVQRTADPKLAGRSRQFLGPEIEQALEQVLMRLDSGRGFPLATEHLLLGLTMSRHEVAAWLAAHHVESEELEADICARYGINLSPLEVDLDDSPIPLAETVSADSKIVYSDAADNLPVMGSDDGTPEAHPVRNVTNAEGAGADAITPAKSIGNVPETGRPPEQGDVSGSKVSISTTPGSAGTPRPTPDARLTSHPSQAPTAAERFALLRILDASANRAGEAVRVVEDYVRFALDDALLTGLCKEIRHELKVAVSEIDPIDRLATRDTPGDVGTTLSTEGERSRGDLFDVATANVRRLQESLRSLEEFGKLIDPDFAAACKRLRYRSYTLHQAVARLVEARRRLASSHVYVLIDGRESPEAFETLVGSVIAGGADIVQLRDKRLDDRALLDRAVRLRRHTRDAGRLFIMNDRADLAVAADADGVHVGQDELTAGDARRIVGPRRLVGVSTHSLEQLRQAVLDGADYVGLGPTFPSETKSFEHFPGLQYLRAAAAETTLPAFAIGGITAENVDSVVAAGIRRVAVAGAVTSASDPAAVLREIRSRVVPASATAGR